MSNEDNVTIIDGRKYSKIRKMKRNMRKHVKKHWKYYTAGAIGITVGSVLGVRMDLTKYRALPVYTANAAVKRMGRPSNITMNLKTQEMWASQGAAARARGISQSNMSRHLTGKVPDIYGDVYAVVGKMYG